NRGDEIPELEHGALPSRRSRGGKEPRRMNASGAACSRHLPLWGRSSSRSDGGRGGLAFHNQPTPSPSLPHKGREQFAAGSYLHKRPERRKACRGARERRARKAGILPHARDEILDLLEPGLGPDPAEKRDVDLRAVKLARELE